jgi:hypothetical protein
MAKTIHLDVTTKRAIAVGIAALCACVVGAILVVGRGSGSTGLDAARLRPGQAASPRGWYGGSGSDGSGRATPATPRMQDDSTFEQFRTCLEDHGVTLPSPGAGRPSTPSSDLRAAFDACRRYLPDRPFGGRGFRRGGLDGPDDDAPGSGSRPGSGSGSSSSGGSGSQTL